MFVTSVTVVEVMHKDKSYSMLFTYTTCLYVGNINEFIHQNRWQNEVFVPSD